MDICVQKITATLQRFFANSINKKNPRRVIVGYSGGVDSTVLLHLVADYFHNSTSLPTPAPQLIAAYINHGLHTASSEWEKHCRKQCIGLGIKFLSTHIQVVPCKDQSLEEAARILRYRALCQWLDVGDVLLTAHHQNDQAETVLLQMLRGSGAKGLAAMPEVKCDSGIYLVRPMLGITRQQILLHANTHQLSWIEDSTNDDLRYDRNYVRHRIVPMLNQRWQQWHRTFSRVASHQSEMVILLNKFADQLVRQCVHKNNVLDVQAALSLTFAEKKLLVRRWLEWQKLPLPREKQLQNLLDTFLTQLSEAGGMVCWKGVQVRRYRNELFAMSPLKTINKAQRNSLQWLWQAKTDLMLTEIDRQLHWQQLVQQLPELANQPCLTVRLRHGGEKFLRFGKHGCYHQSLKKWFQATGVPPWQRDKIPLIYTDNKLRLIWSNVN